ncbi:MAG: type IV secretion system family protein [Gammaproteobacteria bacterium]|nr:type IV secretion system family protein [Gammaproteobacteria bacterium]
MNGNRREMPWWALIGTFGLLVVPVAARAQWAVIDVQAVAHLAQEVQMLQQALATAQAQLQQDRLAFQSITGPRGMARLLAGTQRNYLPPDWRSIAGLAAGAGGTYAGLAAAVQQQIRANAVMPASLLAALTPSERARIGAARARVATAQVLFRAALANSSARFAALQSLIAAIPTANDQKAILDLEARIGAEQTMLQDERAKLDSLAGAMQAETAQARQQIREARVTDQGRFDTRFRPVP